MQVDVIDWLLASDEPWTRYRTLVELLNRPAQDADVLAARRAMLQHPRVRALIEGARAWGDAPIRRHNDAGHPLHLLSTLADFGVPASDRGLAGVVKAVMAHQSDEGAFLSLVNVAPAFGGTGENQWAWMLCDAPTLVYALRRMGLADDSRVSRATAHLAALVEVNGWRCAASPKLGKFHGPGRQSDPCPIANLLALRALALVPEWRDSPAARAGVGMLLQHWERRREVKYYLFGMGTDFRKLKYPFVWYDILHAVDVLSRFPCATGDARFQDMLGVVTQQADADGRYTAGSMYQAWKGWSFADKKQPSPWLTFAVARIQTRLQGTPLTDTTDNRQPISNL